MAKLAGKNLKFCRCPVEGHGQDCGLAAEMRSPVPRTTSKRQHLAEQAEKDEEAVE